MNFAITTMLADESLGNIRGFGPLGDPQDPGGLLEGLISSIIGLMVVGAILWFIVQVIIAGYNFMTAGGDSKAFGEARSRLVNAVIGLIVAFMALVFGGMGISWLLAKLRDRREIFRAL